MSSAAIPSPLEIARDLVRFNTTVDEPGHEPIAERACQEHVADLLSAAGFEVDLWEPEVDDVADHPMYRTGQHWRDRPIVVGRLPGTGGGRSLMFNGHIDTVPAGDPSAWTVDPWGAEVRDGRLYGRGACDMKGGVASMLHAALAVAGSGRRLPGDLVVEVVTDEEVNGMGTIAALRRGHRADVAVVPEPTGLDIWVAFRGILVGELTVHGRKGHVEVAQPHFSQGGAVNAVHRLVDLLRDLRGLDARWRDRPDKQHPLCSTGEVNVTTLTGGDFYSNVPDRASATLNICYVPGEEDEAGYGGRVKAEVERHVQAAAGLDSWLSERPPELQWLADFPPAEIEPDEAVVTELAACVVNSIGVTPRILGLDTWDDTVSLIRAGMPSVSFGPGSNDQAHAVDEFVEIDQLDQCAAAMREFAAAWCSSASPTTRTEETQP